jgi:hypothetical protein
LEKLDQIFIATVSALGAMGGFIIKKLHTRIDKIEYKVDGMDNKLLTRDDIKQISDTQTLILKHLLEHRATENTDVHK